MVFALLKAQANLASTNAQAKRYEELVGSNGVSQQNYDNAVAAEKQAQADVASAKAAIETAQINLDYTRVICPFAVGAVRLWIAGLELRAVDHAADLRGWSAAGVAVAQYEKAIQTAFRRSGRRFVGARRL